MSDTLTSATRTVDSLELPVPGTYDLDAAHSEIGFKVRHLGVSKVRGRFTDATSTIEVAEDPQRSRVETSIRTESVDTRDEQRDGHLRSDDFFGSDQHPTIEYRSTGVSSIDANGDFVVEGELTVKGVTKAVHLRAHFDGGLIDPWGNARFGFSAHAEIDREDFGLTWNQTLDAGGLLVGKKVTIEIEGEAVRRS